MERSVATIDTEVDPKTMGLGFRVQFLSPNASDDT